MLPGAPEQHREALHQRLHIPCPKGIPRPSMPLLVLVMQFLLHTYHSLVSSCLTRSPVQREELMRLLGPLHLVVLLFSQGTGYWMFVLCFQSLQMGLLEGFSLVVKLDVVLRTIVPGFCSPPISSSLGSAPRAGRAGLLLGSSLGGSS